MSVANAGSKIQSFKLVCIEVYEAKRSMQHRTQQLCE